MRCLYYEVVHTTSKGVIHFLPLIIIALLVTAFVAITLFPGLKVPSSTPQTQEASPSASPSEAPSISSSATPQVVVSPSPSVKPTPSAVSGPPGSGYSRYSVATERGNFTVSVVSIDMAGVRMITDTANDTDCGNDCPVMPLGDYVSRNGGFAGINGTYFCPPDYASCAGKINSFDYPVFNTRLGKWINGGNLFWDSRSMVYYNGGLHFARNANSGAGGGPAAIVNAPGLIDGGQVIVESFPLSDQQRAKGSRGGIGIRGTTVYLVIASSADMIDFAYIFKSLGADYALNLDGGGSSALWFGGYKVGPGRNLPNAVIFAR